MMKQRPTRESYALSHPQKRIWYTEKMLSESSLHNIGGAVIIGGQVDLALLQRSIESFIQRHDSFGIKLLEQDGEGRQYFETPDINIPAMDFEGGHDAEERFIRWAQQEMERPFQLEASPLFFFALFKINQEKCGYFVKLHHLIADGWSIARMTEQICRTYELLAQGMTVHEKAPRSYREYLAAEQQYLDSDKFLRSKAYWNEKFHTIPEELFPVHSQSIKGRRKTYSMDKPGAAALHQFSGDTKLSLNALFVAAMFICLHKLYRKEELVLGIPVLNRSGQSERSLFGMFTSTMPLKVQAAAELSALDFINAVQKELHACYRHQRYPYNLLLQDLEWKRNGGSHLFQVSVNYYSTKLSTGLHQLTIENVEMHNGEQLFPLQLIIKEWEDTDGISLEFDYMTELFAESQIDHLYEYMLHILDQMMSKPSIALEDIELLNARHLDHIVYGLNDKPTAYPEDKTIVQLIEEQVRLTPERVALQLRKEELTYKEMDDKANDMAHSLADHGVEAGMIVAIMMTHSVETVIAILGILKAGAAYLPIDPDYPAERIEYMIKNSGVGIVLTNGQRPQIQMQGAKVIDAADCLRTEHERRRERLSGIAKPTDLAYVIYTSGSTGNPKGVMIEHRNVVHYIYWAKEMYTSGGEEAFALYSSLSFDLTVTSIFTPLISGGKIVIYPDSDESEFVLYTILRENRCTVVKLTPAHLSLIQDMDLTGSSVRRFIVGGEDLKTAFAKKIHVNSGGRIDVLNEYGPTETAVGCMIHKYSIDEDVGSSVPIGRPAANVQLYVLDDKGKPVPCHYPGELYISGDGVARGYLGQPGMTDAKFLNNPFVAGKRMYRTGDWVKQTAQGLFHYIGRTDQQVKIRGHRIELAEIEQQLLQLGMVKDCAVIDRQDNGNTVLAAYIVLHDGKGSEPEIRRALSDKLPYYMIPSWFVAMDKLPLTANGKVNRDALPKYRPPHREQASESAGTSLELRLLSIIENVLEAEPVALNDNFYHLGGDSIKAIQLASKLKNEGLMIKVKDILANPVIKDFIACAAETEEADQKLCEGTVRYSPILHWFKRQRFHEPSHYNQSVALRLHGNIEAARIAEAMKTIVHHHDSLRLNRDVRTGELFYNPLHLQTEFAVPQWDLSGMSADRQRAQMKELGTELKSGFDLANGLLMKAGLFHLGEGGKTLLLTAHHIVIDGVSWRILLEDLAALLKQPQDDPGGRLPSKTDSLQSWVERLETDGAYRAVQELEYWQEAVASGSALSAEYERGEDTVQSMLSVHRELGEEETRLWLSKSATAYGTKPVELLIAALGIVLSERTAADDILFELEGHGREQLFQHIDISRTIGWFTVMYPVSLHIRQAGLAQQIKSIKEQLRRIPNNGFYYSILKYMNQALHEPEPDSVRKLVRLNYLGEFVQGGFGGQFELDEQLDTGPEVSPANTLTSLIDINAIVVNKKLQVAFAFSGNRFTEAAVNDFAEAFMAQFTAIVRHCIEKESVEYTVSDFETLDMSQEDLEGLLDSFQSK